jgi:hypothetical protein
VSTKNPVPDLDNMKFVLFVVVPADDRNNRPLNGLYCFDGHSFIRSRTINGEQQQCEENGMSHGGASTVSDEDFRKAIR